VDHTFPPQPHGFPRLTAYLTLRSRMVILPRIFSLLLVGGALAADFPSYDHCVFDCLEKWHDDSWFDSNVYFARGTAAIVVLNESELYSKSQDRYCRWFAETIPLQRCYMSYCGGLNARVPPPSAIQPLVWAYLARSWVAYTDKGFNAKPHDFRPIPIGLAAYCFDHQNETLYDALVNPSDAEAVSVQSILATDGRMKLPFPLRWWLMPMWLSSNMMDNWNYNLKMRHIDVEITEPRALSDLHAHLIGTSIFAITAYSHLLSLSSRSKYWIIEGAQIVALCLAPVLPVVQLAHNIVDALVHMWSDNPWEWPYLCAAICGQHIYHTAAGVEPFRGQILEVDVAHLDRGSLEERDGRWWWRLVGINANLCVLFLTIYPYIKRVFFYSFGRADYVAAMGTDHRSGWVAIAALVPVVQGLILHMLNSEWRAEQRLGFDRQMDVADWKYRVALDVAVAALVQETLIRVTGRITPLALFNRNFAEYLQYIITAILIAIPFIVSAWSVISHKFSNPNSWLRRITPWLVLLSAFAYAVLVFVLQIFVDMEELADLRLGFVLPWNYRWMIPGPSWLTWWGL
jgi:hypothetical protein